MISVIIPLYNKKQYIYDTICCVLNQDFEEFELVIIDDGSTDGSCEVVKTIKDSRIKIYSKSNGGVSSARNMGVEKAIYDYVAFLDADDFWSPNHLSTLVGLINEFKDISDYFVTNFSRRFPDDKLVVNRFDLDYGLVGNYFKSVLKGAVIHTSCVCVSKKAFIEVGGFDVRMSRGEDLDLWIRLALRYRLAYSNVVTEIYTINAANNSGKKVSVKKSVVFYLDFRDISDKYHFIYYIKMLFYKSMSVLIKDRDIKGFFMLYYSVLKNTFKKK